MMTDRYVEKRMCRLTLIFFMPADTGANPRGIRAKEHHAERRLSGNGDSD